MGHTQQFCVRIVLLPLKRLATVFRGRSAFLKQQKTDLPPAEHNGAPVFFADKDDISVFCRRRLLTRPPQCRLLHIQ
ncbi:hypothetical protein TNCV_1662361 [Trichonephila clavipes]|nr:hypothetical protein TNCV_1662361 [Trichonephila clavipes]